MKNLLMDNFRYNTHGFLSISSGLFILSLAVLVLLKDPKSTRNRLFFLFALSGSIWIFCFGMISLVLKPEQAYLWMALSYVSGVPFIPVYSFLLITEMRGIRPNKHIAIIGLLLAILATFLLILWNHQIIEIHNFNWGRYPRWRDAYPSRIHQSIVLINFFFFMSLTFWNLYQGYRSSETNKDKNLWRILIITFSLPFIGCVDFLTASGFDIHAIGYVFLILFFVAMAILIFQDNLFQMTLSLKQFFVITIIYLFLFSMILPLAYPVLKNSIEYQIIDPTILVLSLGSIIGLVLSTGPLLYSRFIKNSYWLKDFSTTGLAHELKSPIAIIQSALDYLIQNDFNNQRADVYRYIKIVEKNVLKLDLYVQDLLNIAKIQNRDTCIIKAPFNLSKLIQDVAISYQPKVEKKGLAHSLNIQPGVLINGDKDKIEQVISNVLSNAIKFSSGGVINTSLTKKEELIFISVQDQGIGIEKGFLKKIFNRFYQVNPNTKGSGIGLTIAKAWVEAHGGTIWAETCRPKGLKINIYIPLC